MFTLVCPSSCVGSWPVGPSVSGLRGRLNIVVGCLPERCPLFIVSGKLRVGERSGS